MKWTVIQLQKFRENGMEIDETVNVAQELKLRDPEIRDVTPVHVTGRADINSQKVTFQLRLTGSFTLPCSRTLADVQYPFDIRTMETFLLKPSEYDLSGTEELHELQGDVVDLLPIVFELLLLEVPMQVFCEDAKEQEGLSQGKGWEVKTEDQLMQEQKQEKQKIDPRLAGLAQLLENNQEKN